MSYPNSQVAENHMKKMLHDAIKEVCDIKLKVPKKQKDKPTSNDEAQLIYSDAKVTLKQSVIDKNEAEGQDEQKQVTELYDKVFDQLKKSAKSWYDELAEYETIKPEKIIRSDSELS